MPPRGRIPALKAKSPVVAKIQAAAEKKIAAARAKASARVSALQTAARERIAAQRAAREGKMTARTRAVRKGGPTR